MNRWYGRILWIITGASIALMLVVGYTAKPQRELQAPTGQNVTFSGPLITSQDGFLGISLRYPDRDTGESKITKAVSLKVGKGASEAVKQKAVIAQLDVWAKAYNTLAQLPVESDIYAQPHCDDCGGGCSYVVLPGRALDYGGACHACLGPYNCNVAVYWCPPDPAPTCNP